MALRARFPLIDRTVERFAYWWAFLGPGGLVWIVMSWVASYFTPIARYGIGAIIFAGLAAACILILVASISLIAWRYFHPIGAGEGLEAPRTGIGEQQAAVSKAELRQLDARCDQLRADIARHDNLVLVQRSVNDELRGQLEDLQAAAKSLGDRFAAHEQITVQGTYLLIRALRARDARRDFLIPNDQIAMSLGKKLMYPDAYSSAASWLGDYQAWRAALRTIDGLMIEWAKAQHLSVYASLFDLKGHHYEQAPMPPDNIRSDETIIAFKTVCQVQSSYANQREGIFSFFDERAVYPG